MNEFFMLSEEGLRQLPNNLSQDDQKNIMWTTEKDVSLPIKMSRNGLGALPPRNLHDMFQDCLRQWADKPALSQKFNNKWETYSYRQYYDKCLEFAQACINHGIPQGAGINIIGFNCREWNISWLGGAMSGYLPVGVYSTNNAEACHYVAENSDAALVIVENNEQLEKYIQNWSKLPLLQKIVVINDKPNSHWAQHPSKILSWSDFVKPTLKVPSEQLLKNLNVWPGKCCTLVYTSGTTGNPKGVMLSHDNYSWVAEVTDRFQKQVVGEQNYQDRTVSYLPLSHVAGQLFDIIMPLHLGMHVHFAEPTALQGTLVNTLQEVRPTKFLGVPRVWEKIYEKMMMVAKQNGFVKTKIATWAKSQGIEGSFNQVRKMPVGYQFQLANKLVYTKVKENLGLDQCELFFTGAAPLSNEIRNYFLSLNIPIVNVYGMSECSGPQTITDPNNYDDLGINFLKSCGAALNGTHMKIAGGQEGEVQYKGRHIFMGYFKNEQATRETIDREGYLKSGDIGQLDKRGNLSITGRIKELIITAGGENVAPVLIENNVKKQLGNIIANSMVIGEQRKYLTILLTLKQALNAQGKPMPQISEDGLALLKELGIEGKTKEEVSKNPKFIKAVNKGIDEANKMAISKAQYIRKWVIIDDFSVGDELTPTLKLKRKVVEKKYVEQIENMYREAKL